MAAPSFLATHSQASSSGGGVDVDCLVLQSWSDERSKSVSSYSVAYPWLKMYLPAATKTSHHGSQGTLGETTPLRPRRRKAPATPGRW